jgi:phosphoglycolate phosphatase
MKNLVILFDFDGTIANTLESIIHIMNKLSIEFGFKKIQENQVEILRGKHPLEILRSLEISLFKLPFVVRKARKEINSHIAFLSPTVDLLPIFQYLKRNNFKIGLVTSNTEENVRKFLHANDLDLFDLFYTTKKIFGKDRTLSKIIKDLRLEKSQVFFIGDELRDIEAGKKAGVKTIGVSWGYNTREALKRGNPDFLIDSPKELEKIIVF